MNKTFLMAAVLAVSTMTGCGGEPGEARVFLMSIDSSSMMNGQATEGCPGFNNQVPNQTQQTTFEGTGRVDNWSVFDGWDGSTMLGGSIISYGFSYGRDFDGGEMPDYIVSTDDETFTGKVTTTINDKEAGNLTLTETNSVTVTFEEFGSDLKGRIQYEYTRTCTSGQAGICDSSSMKPITCKSGTATFIGRQVESNTVHVAPGGY